MSILFVFNPIFLLIVYIAYTKSSGIYKTVLKYVGGTLDVVVNLTWFTVIFWDVPKELLLTKRVERLKQSGGYRGKLAKLICKSLNYFEEYHCV